jgi:hypothetical protein
MMMMIRRAYYLRKDDGFFGSLRKPELAGISHGRACPIQPYLEIIGNKIYLRTSYFGL